MGYDGTGQFTRLYSWQAEEAAGVGIVSDHHDQEDDNFAQGLNLAFLRDGQAAATGHWDLANHRIGNLAGGTADGDAVNLAQLTGSGALPTPDFRKSLNLIGADLNGRVNFMSATGVNGLGWFGADLSWLARLKETDKTTNRLVLNNKFDGTGTDVIIADDYGNLGVTSLTYNLSQDPDGDFRAIAPGWVGRLAWNSAGSLTLYNIDTATVTDPYVNVTSLLKEKVRIDTANGNVALTLNASETGDHSVSINGGKGTELRWNMQLGTAHTETGGDSGFGGSHFYLTAYNNSGAGGYTPFYIMRDTGKVGMPYGITGSLTVDGVVYLGSVLSVTGSNNLIMGGNNVYLRPNGALNAAGEMILLNTGYLRVNGMTERSGTGGSFGSQIHNSLYAAGNDLRWYIGTGIVGYYTPACDYRIKRDIRPLPSSWDAVKKLRPVMFKPAAFGDDPESPYKDEDVDRVGFLAHELQDALGEHAATGTKDAEEDVFEQAEDGSTKVVGKRPAIQGPDVMAVVASLCSALQEAQLRIEALEARLAA